MLKTREKKFRDFLRYLIFFFIVYTTNSAALFCIKFLLSRWTISALYVILIFFLGFSARAKKAFTSLGAVHPDEIFQSMEMAHRLAFGRGYVFWEFKEGLRSWIMPGLFAAVYRVLFFFGMDNGYSLNVGVKIFSGTLHPLALVFCFLLLRKYLDRARAFLYMVPAAVFYYSVFISLRTLGETMTIPFMIGAVFFADRYFESVNRRDMIITGALAGMSFWFRFQSLSFVGGLGLAVLIYSRRRVTDAAWFSIGAVAAITVQGVVDLAAWGGFPASFFNYMNYNFIHDQAAAVQGVKPVWWYVPELLRVFTPPVLIAAALYACYAVLGKRQILLVLPFLIFFAIHTITGHKDFRFIFPVVFVVPLLVSLALEKMICRAPKRYRASLTLIAAASLLLFNLYQFHQFKGWDPNGPKMRLNIALGQIPDLRRAYIFDFDWIGSAGHAYFHKDAELHCVYLGKTPAPVFRPRLKKIDCREKKRHLFRSAPKKRLFISVIAKPCTPFVFNQ